ncbi:MAG: alpha/beta fold hydrolase [Desulfobacteraceae bacterium]
MPYVDNHGTRIHYDLEGQGPDLILVPGFAGTLEDWREFGYTPTLGKHNRLVLIDPRGRGASDRPHDPGAYAMKHMVNDLVAVLDDLKVEKAHYFGYSMGAVIGFSIPFHAAHRFHSLILGGAAYPVEENAFRDDPLVVAIQQGLEQALEEAPDRPMEAFVAALEKALGPYPPERRARMLAGDARALIATARAMRKIQWPPAAEALPRIDLPCFLFAGEKDTFHAGAEQCAALIPHASFRTLKGLGHLEAYAHSDMVLPMVCQFLDRVGRH